MSYEDTKVNQLTLNILSQEQYKSAEKSENELYLIKDIDNTEIFVAIYEVTPFEDISNALSNGKICLCENYTTDGKTQYGQLVIAETDIYYFEASSSAKNISKNFLKVTSENVWSIQSVRAASSSSVLTLTLSATDWIGTTAPFTQTLSVEAFSAEQNGIADIAPTATAIQREAAREAMLFISSQTDGTITVYADGEMPEIDIPISIILLG